jgi:beta-glucanase (GH16 family)
VTVRAKFPAQGTGLWPAIWLLGSNCQNTNPFTADVGYSTCPALGSPSYAEIDMVECDLDNWCQLALANLANSGSGGSSFPRCGYPVDTNFHLFTLTWAADRIEVAVDGQPTGCSYASPAWTIPSTPMFLIIQTQTGGSGGTPDDALLPATLQVDFVKVTQP